MKNITILFILIGCFSNPIFSQEITIVKGKLNNISFSDISLQCDENPFGARDEFKGIVLDSGKFEIQAEIFEAESYYIFVDNSPVLKIFLCPGQNLTINVDSTGVKFDGPTSDFNQWNNVLMGEILNRYTLEFAEKNGIEKDNLSSAISFLFELREKDASRLDKLASDFNLNSCEYNYCKYRMKYFIYTSLWSDLKQRNYSIDNDAYRFMHELPLDDTLAAKSSVDYNRAIDVYIFLKLRLENGWYETNSYDFTSDTFNYLYYNKIITEIKNENIKNITLSRRVINLLNAGSTSAELLVKKYLNDCSDQYYKKIVFKYYNDYLKQKDWSKKDLKIKELSGPLFEELKKYKGKVLYIDFWASWCGPCLQSIPFTNKLKEKYKDRELEVIYVNINDNIGNAETAARKFGLKGELIYLNKDQSTEIQKLLGISSIPHYVLADKQGNIINTDAPDPRSLTIEKTINELIEK